jgi:hypothetical protein
LTDGSLGGTNAGGYDAFIRKYDASGTLEWTRQFGTSEYDNGVSVSEDGLGGVYISGWTEGSLGGPNAGSRAAFVAKFTDLLLGDVNLDGEVNGLDVDPFVDVLLSGPYEPEADMNGDQVVNGHLESLARGGRDRLWPESRQPLRSHVDVAWLPARQNDLRPEKSALATKPRSSKTL